MARIVDEHGVPAESAWEAFAGLFTSDRRREKKRTPPEEDADDRERSQTGRNAKLRGRDGTMQRKR